MMYGKAIMLKILNGEVVMSGLAQAEIARRANLPPTVLCSILGGHKGFSVEMYERILRAVGRVPIYSTAPAPLAHYLLGEDRT